MRPAVTVEVPGLGTARLEGADTFISYRHQITIGRWDDKRTYVMLQSSTGGAHCCNEVQLVVPEEGRLRVVELGSWDGDYLDRQPRDIDGDGRVDFVFQDDAFLYAFASYAASSAPPQIINVVDGQAVDASTRPGFRRLFERAMARDRKICLGQEGDGMRNGACAAYVASAARVGRFESAWAEMLRAYDRESEWINWGSGCKVAPGFSACPSDQITGYKTFPEALRQFLIEHGYIPRRPEHAFFIKPARPIDEGYS